MPPCLGLGADPSSFLFLVRAERDVGVSAKRGTNIFYLDQEYGVNASRELVGACQLRGGFARRTPWITVVYAASREHVFSFGQSL